MAMTKCKECGNEISTTAATCPKCGAKVRRTSLIAKLALGFVVVGVLGAIVSNWSASHQKDEVARGEASRRATLTAEQRSQEDTRKAAAAAAKSKNDAASEAAFQRTVAVAKAVKASAKDPASVDFIDAYVTEAGAVALEYRAKNSFGALVINYAVVAPDGKSLSGGKSDVAPLWNKHIANTKGRDMTSSLRGARSLGVL